MTTARLARTSSTTASTTSWSQGATPLFFLDYLATGKLEEGVVHQVVAGVAEGCRQNGIALLGGETAQMPGFYGAGEYDLAGFIVGVVERGRILDGSEVRSGDVLIGLPSSGLHTNGYSLARRILFEAAGLEVDDPVPGLGETVGDALLKIHRSYAGVLSAEIGAGSVSALAHITGGGDAGQHPALASGWSRCRGAPELVGGSPPLPLPAGTRIGS